MSSLNLNPNPTVMLVQTGIFIANFWAIKKLFLEPYLKLADKRSNLTFGNREEADALNRRNEEALKKLTAKLEQARDEAAKMRHQVAEQTEVKRQSVVGDAESEAKKVVEEVRASIQIELEKEKSKLPGLISELTDEIYSQTIRA